MSLPSSIWSPFKSSLFRNVWLASLLSNTGTMIQAVSAAWFMTELTSDVTMIALVQTAAMLPMMLFAIMAGAIADVFDRRRVTIFALVLAFSGAVSLSILSVLDALTPNLILLLCFFVGCGTTLYSPAWQASVRDLVATDDMPRAIALNSINFSLARSLGPAVGGAIVAIMGASVAFIVNALSYIPIIGVLLFWRRSKDSQSMPNESLVRVIGLGVRYVLNTPSIRIVLIRTVLIAFGGSVVLALLPLIVQVLDNGAFAYGLLLGAFGIGSILGALLMPVLSDKFNNEPLILGAAILISIALVVIGFSRCLSVTLIALVPIGACWTLSFSLLSVVVQLSSSRWVVGRVIAAFQTAVATGIAIGSWVWGMLADKTDVSTALFGAALYSLLALCISFWLKVPNVKEMFDDTNALLPDPEVGLSLHGRSGPVTIQVEYHIDPKNRSVFRSLMEDIRLSRRRNGAYGWSLTQDIVAIDVWLERYRFPTWHDYLRHRSRITNSEYTLIQKVKVLHKLNASPLVRRFIDSSSSELSSVKANSDIIIIEP